MAGGVQTISLTLVLEAHAFAHKGQRKLKKDGIPLGKFDRAAQTKYKNSAT